MPLLQRALRLAATRPNDCIALQPRLIALKWPHSCAGQSSNERLVDLPSDIALISPVICPRVPPLGGLVASSRQTQAQNVPRILGSTFLTGGAGVFVAFP